MEKNNFNIRRNFAVAVYIFLFAILLLNLFRIQILDRDYWITRGMEQYSRDYSLAGKRGEIETINGERIAYDKLYYNIILDPTIVKESSQQRLCDII